MTIEEARKILGDNYKYISDQEIERLINDLHVIAKLTIRDLINKKQDGTESSHVKAHDV